MRYRFLVFISILSLLFCSTQNALGQSVNSTSLSLEAIQPKIEPDRVSYLIQYHDQLLVFNIKKMDQSISKRGPGVYQNGQFEFFDDFEKSPRISAHTIWKNHLIAAGSLPFSFLENPRTKTTTHRLGLYDGKKWELFDHGFSGRVSAMVQWQDDLVIAGDLAIEGHPELKYLARWDGESWTGFNGQPSGGGEPRISSLTIHQGKLVIGGVFARMGETVVRNLASYDGTSWTSIGSGPNGRIAQVVSFEDDLFVFGAFQCIGGQAIEELARWDGHQWHSMKTFDGEDPDQYHSWDLKFLPTAQGLFVAGFTGRFTGRKNSQLACWKNGAWDMSVPDVHQHYQTIEPTPAFLEFKKTLKPSKQLSQPRINSGPEYFQIITAVENRRVNALAWYRNELIISTSKRNTESISPASKLSVVRGDALANFLEEEKTDGRYVGNYKNGALIFKVGKKKSAQLVLKKDGDETVLGTWHTNHSFSGPFAFYVQGDTIITVGNFSFINGLPFQHAAYYCNDKWNAMGEGLPFDLVLNPRLHKTGSELLLTAQFKNYADDYNAGMMKWNGQQWVMVELDYLGYDQARFANDGTFLYRSGHENPIMNHFRDPDHILQSFPNHSNPYIEKWQHGQWLKVWQGRSGAVNGFYDDGHTLWCTISQGRDANLLKLEDGHWTTMSNQVIQGSKPSSLNPMGKLYFKSGVPVTRFFLGRRTRWNIYRLASLQNGHWYWFGPEFTTSRELKIASGSILLDAYFFNDKEEKPQHGILKWEGAFPHDESVPSADLAALDKWEAECRASNQNKLPLVDLPFPKGLNRNDEKIPGSDKRNPRWELSAWPNSKSMENSVHKKGKNTIVIEPNTHFELSLYFDWNISQPGLLEFEYRLLEPENWVCSEDSFTVSGKCSPHIVSRINSRTVFLNCWPHDQQWHKVRFPFGTTSHEPPHSSLTFSAGHTESGRGSLEIKNLRIRKKKREDHQDLVKEITQIWKNYSCPSWPAARIDRLCRDFENAIRKDNSDWVLSRYFSFNTSSDFGRRLFVPGDYKSSDFRNQKLELQTVVENFSSGEISSGWIPGGGLYVKSDHLPRSMEKGNYFNQLLDDATQIRFIKGLIVDLRRQSYPSMSTEYTISRMNKTWSLFTEKPIKYGQIQEETGTSSRSDLILQPASNPWKSTPVVVLVDKTTPGLLVMALNCMPRIKTVGRPSAPVSVPEKLHLLQNGEWGCFPAGRVDDINGNNVSLCRIAPDVEVPLNATFDAAIREALPYLGLKADEESGFCPVDFQPVKKSEPDMKLKLR